MRRLVREVNEECGQIETSSDEEDDFDALMSRDHVKPSYRSMRYQSRMHNAQGSPDHSGGTNVVDTFAQRPTSNPMANTNLPGRLM